MDISIVYGQESTQHDLFIEAAENHFDNVMAVPLEGIRILFDDGPRVMYKSRDICEFDACFLRLFGGDMLFGEHLPEILRRRNVYTQMDSDSATVANNKFYSTEILAEAGIPVPRSSYLLSTEETEKAAQELGYPVIIKLISGYGGKGVMRASNRSDLGPVVDTLTLFEQDILLQEFLENDGEDIRIIVVGEDTFSYQRVSKEEEWRSNISRGGTRVRYDAPQELRDMAVRAARITGFDICGIDIIESDEGPMVVEVNMSPGVPERAQEVIGADLPDVMMSHMHAEAVGLQSDRGL